MKSGRSIFFSSPPPKRRERFQYADTLTRDKATLLTILDYWLTYWRDALLLATNSQAPIINIDFSEALYQTAHSGYKAIHDALQATRRTIYYLERNVNTRLCMEVLVLDYPYPFHSSS